MVFFVLVCWCLCWFGVVWLISVCLLCVIVVGCIGFGVDVCCVMLLVVWLVVDVMRVGDYNVVSFLVLRLLILMVLVFCWFVVGCGLGVC